MGVIKSREHAAIESIQKTIESGKVGQKFGKLTIQKLSAIDQNGGRRWNCICSCGRKVTFDESRLVEGIMDRCMHCFRAYFESLGIPKSVYYNTVMPNSKGELKGTLYRAWNGIVNCSFSNDPNKIKSYSGRGIVICSDWKKFENFYRDMGDRPEGLELGRIDKNRGWYKENCRWMPNALTKNHRQDISGLFEDDELLSFEPPVVEPPKEEKKTTSQKGMSEKLVSIKMSEQEKINTARANIAAIEKALEALEDVNVE